MQSCGLLIGICYNFQHAQEFGLVNYIDDMGDVQVRCNNNRLFHFNIEVLAKVHISVTNNIYENS